MALREEFPQNGEVYMDGTSDGVRYELTFGGASQAHSYEMIRAFLAEQGYENIPLPESLEDLRRFRHPVNPKGQILLFEENGYCHNPVKVLFPLDRRKKRVLHLVIYNENAPNHLLRFHGKIGED